MQGSRDAQAAPWVISPMGLANLLPCKWMIRAEAHEGGDIFDARVCFLRAKPCALLYTWIERDRSQPIPIKAPYAVNSTATTNINQGKLLFLQRIGYTSQE